MAKPLEEGNICPIILEEIKENEYYMTCRRCNKHFKLEPLKRWLEDNNSCPLCRSEWLNNENPRFKVYKNCEPKKYALVPLLHCGLKVIEKKVNNVFNFNLEGWADRVKDNIEMSEYDDLIEKLNNKYQSNNNPYLELLYMFGEVAVKHYLNK